MMQTDPDARPQLSVAQAKAALTERAEEAQVGVGAARAAAGAAVGIAIGRVMTAAVIGVSVVLAASSLTRLLGGGRNGTRAGARRVGIAKAGALAVVVPGMVGLGLRWIAARVAHAAAVAIAARMMGDRGRRGASDRGR